MASIEPMYWNKRTEKWQREPLPCEPGLLRITTNSWKLDVTPGHADLLFTDSTPPPATRDEYNNISMNIIKEFPQILSFRPQSQHPDFIVEFQYSHHHVSFPYLPALYTYLQYKNFGPVTRLKPADDLRLYGQYFDSRAVTIYIFSSTPSVGWHESISWEQWEKLWGTSRSIEHRDVVRRKESVRLYHSASGR